MRKAINFGIGTALGSLLGSRFISSTHRFEWGRAAVVGLSVFLVMWLVYSRKGSNPST